MIYKKTIELNNNITEAYKKLELAEKINNEVQKMKSVTAETFGVEYPAPTKA